jgi:RNA polymerase sigma factor (sigma-70 family)
VSASYVHRTATTAAVDLIRRKRVGGERFPLDPDLPNGTPSNPETRLEAQEAAERVSTALEKLDERRRPVVRMYLAGYGHKEIAGLLGWSTAATRNLLYRGLADLRADLAAMAGGTG